MSTALGVPPITIEQYERFEGYPGLKDELIYGQIYLSPQAKPLHQQVAKNLARLLDAALAGQAFTAQQKTNIRFQGANSMPAPDVFVVTRSAWEQACETDDYLASPPILVAEIISPANRRKRVEMKVELYVSQGVREVWLIHPKRQTLEVFRATERHFVSGLCALPEPLAGSVDAASFFVIGG